MSGDKQVFPRSLKKGEKYDATNYRRVLLTCVCCKTLEHILVSNINKHLALDSILAGCQHKSTKEVAYEHLGRPKLEYAAPVLEPLLETSD